MPRRPLDRESESSGCRAQRCHGRSPSVPKKEILLDVRYASLITSTGREVFAPSATCSHLTPPDLNMRMRTPSLPECRRTAPSLCLRRCGRVLSLSACACASSFLRPSLLLCSIAAAGRTSKRLDDHLKRDCLRLRLAHRETLRRIRRLRGVCLCALEHACADERRDLADDTKDVLGDEDADDPSWEVGHQKGLDVGDDRVQDERHNRESLRREQASVEPLAEHKPSTHTWRVAVTLAQQKLGRP